MFEMQQEPNQAGATPVTVLIAEQVMRTLGSPADLLRVSVHPIGADRYRVNVYAGATAAMARVANSFFLTADEQGNVKSSTPEIVRQYGLKGHQAAPGGRDPGTSR